MTVAGSFVRLLRRIQPVESELAKAKLHAHSIRRRLETCFEVKKFLIVGSHSRSTAIRGHSDVDYFVVLSRSEVQWGEGWVNSSTLLKRVRDELSDRFQHTDVRRDQQAVVVGFAGGEYAVDVVPAVYQGPTDKGWPVYVIPNGNGAWVRTSPGLHGNYIRKANLRGGGKLRRTAQLLKWWRICRIPSVPLLSFHIEILLAANDLCTGAKSYSTCLADAFHLLSLRECRGLRDPVGLSGHIAAAMSETQRDQACSAVEYASDHAQRAVDAEERRCNDEASRQWNIVFNGQFPV